ncbi:hypothetical protein [Streptomyces sp. NPDC101206]|uniref:hypothetical protein n=1 Tax=Streptomyces sp. NPDC101206 TaxID=3366128 RepID=UPI003815CE7A
MAIELTDELIQLQQASDDAWAVVREAPTDEAYAAWRDRAAEVQAAVTAYAAEIGEPRNKVEATLKSRVRRPVAE